MMEEATKAQATAAAPPPVADPMVDETMAEVEQGLRQEITVTIDEQDAVQKMRAEASVLGERLGLGNMQVDISFVVKGGGGGLGKYAGWHFSCPFLGAGQT